MTYGRPWRVDHSIMINVTWRHFDQSGKQLIVGHTTNSVDFIDRKHRPTNVLRLFQHGGCNDGGHLTWTVLRLCGAVWPLCSHVIYAVARCCAGHHFTTMCRRRVHTSLRWRWITYIDVIIRSDLYRATPLHSAVFVALVFFVFPSHTWSASKGPGASPGQNTWGGHTWRARSTSL